MSRVSCTVYRAARPVRLGACIVLYSCTGPIYLSQAVKLCSTRLTVEDIRLKNPLLSPAEWVSFNAVRTSFTMNGLPPSRQYVDSVDTNRRLVGVADNLDHGRSVWRCSGNECVRLQEFNGLLELVCALRDVARELKILFLDLKMMHRDIVPWNIYIRRETEGSRGFLVDFSHAAVMDADAIAPRPDITPGSSIFMSRAALDKKPTTHCDDLESLYYLLCFIIAGHKSLEIGSSRLPHPALPRFLKRWMLDDPLDVSDGKKYHFTDRSFSIVVQEKFMPLRPLASRLYSFFYNRSTDGAAGAFPYSFTPEQDFNEFLGYFEEAILSIRNSQTVDGLTMTTPHTPNSKRKRDIRDAENSPDLNRMAKRVRTEL
ncbi:hypothetical protein JB92DRAFT_3094405 [Gautieria morchelliformis]|nr:hypothetical protein JB92DRAFT_3094405 [Gautieria morchelliformis]